MSQKNVEVVRQIYGHLALGNFWAIAPLLHPQLAWDWGPDMALVEGTAVYHGPQGVEAATREWLKAWEGAQGSRQRSSLTQLSRSSRSSTSSPDQSTADPRSRCAARIFGQYATALPPA
jgi:hypothetical protein